MSCKHLVKREYHISKLFTAQVCEECGMIREYNPEKKKNLVTFEKKYPVWSEWECNETLKKMLDSLGPKV